MAGSTTIGDYINDELVTSGVPLTPAQLAALYLKNGVSSTDELTNDNMRVIEIAILGVIPKLLLEPDKTTGDTSRKWDKNGVLAYYRLKCAEYGIPDDQYQEGGSISDLSCIW